MADPQIRVHDLRVVVTQASPATADVRPETATETDATVSNPAQAVDGDLTSYAELSDATTAVLTLSQFANTDRVSDAGRDWVELHITGDWANSPNAGDDLQVDIRGVSSDSWTTLDNAAGGAEWDGSERTWTVTTEVGSNLESAWEVRITYTRAAGAGTFRVFDVRVEIGGDVVAPTAAEIAEDVEELAVARFTQWWDTLVATVEAGVVEFGSSSGERSTLFDSLRDSVSASDAYALAGLSSSKARAQAAAYEAAAEAAGFPRFTGEVDP